jgi:hypothetical protein
MARTFARTQFYYSFKPCDQFAIPLCCLLTASVFRAAGIRARNTVLEEPLREFIP